MGFFQLLRRLGRSRTSPVVGEPSDALDEEPRRIVDLETTRTATNVLYIELRRLNTISNHIPLAGVIDPLIEITARIKQTSASAQGLVQLAARVERLTTIVARATQDNPDKGRDIVQNLLGNLQKELASITTDLKAASTRGKLDQFFNSVDNASVLHKHNNALAQIIADCTLATVHDVAKSLHELENLKLQKFYGAERPNMLYDVAGNTGISGGNAYIGGGGGEGEGPQLDMNPDERYKFGKISGGTGGTGGNGVERGGKGGTGKGPLIKMRRRFTGKKT
ncbi:hypothetical protein MSAN_00536900 [Mycena sanguinolenta]|uniref:Uncharacterized protein n=1 Tax=Mycena sanguinolenta TaxID=230812 RepID=A0A8H6Z9S5_9AGAR|nr:hypothetical protein MSAN_00536900 [Mycena sanguinolenta]